jgi:hypothetical protein
MTSQVIETAVKQVLYRKILLRLQPLPKAPVAQIKMNDKKQET